MRQGISNSTATWILVAGWALLAVSAVWFWPIIPIDETRYVSVAWEMWLRDEFLVPHLNGEPYSHKPPLLFWLFQFGWWLFGVNDWWPRLVPGLFGLGSLLVTRSLAYRLWPNRPNIGRFAPFVVLGSLLWSLFSQAILFDVVLTFWVLTALLGALLAAGGKAAFGWIVTGVAIGFGILTKGPVVLLHILPSLILAPWWLPQPSPDWRHWYAGLTAAVLLAAGIALAWAIPAGLQGGKEYADAIFWGQTAGRISESFAHARPWWWYLPLLPLLLFPWSLWPTLWRAAPPLLRKGLSDWGVRLSLAWVVPAFLVFCLISGKQIHYLLPLFPAFGLLATRAADDCERQIRPWPVALVLLAIPAALLLLPLLPHAPTWSEQITLLPLWFKLLVFVPGLSVIIGKPFRQEHTAIPALAFAMIAFMILLSAGVVHYAGPALNTQPLAQRIAILQEQGIPIAYVGKYHGQFQFTGRLQAPLIAIYSEELPQWMEDNPDGYVIQTFRHTSPSNATPVFEGPFRSQRIALWRVAEIKPKQ